MLKCAAAATALLFTLAACGGNPEPKPLPTPSASVGTTPSPSAPALPEAAKGDTDAAAEAFVRHYVATLNFATTSGDVSALHALAQATCGSCLNVKNGISSVYKAKGHIEGGDWRVTQIKALPETNPSRRTVDVAISFRSQKIYRTISSDAQTFTGGKSLLTFVLTKTDSWSVVDWTKAS